MSYALLPRPDGTSYVPVYLGVAGDAEVDLTWDMAVGIAPGVVDAGVEFPDPRGAGFGTLGLTLPKIEGKGKTYAITNGPGAALDTLAGTLFSGLAARGLLAPDKPTVAIQSSKITLTPNPSPGLIARSEPVNGPVTVNFKLTSIAARVDPAAVKVTLAADLTKLAADQDLAIDWLGGVSRVQADVFVELTFKDAPVGMLQFGDGPNIGEVVLTGGKRVIKKEILAKKLGELLSQKDTPRPQDKDVFQARLITLAPRIDGMGLSPVFVVNRFEIDFVAPAKPAGTTYVAPRAGFPAARRVGPPAAKVPRAANPPARRDSAVRRTSATEAPALPPLPAPSEPPARQSLLRRLVPGSR
ncbi:MAG TPA: hypothetical protein VGH33_03380 [Isosphaeraceae bacterium]